MILQHHGISSLFGGSPTPPIPTYEYLLLQNFVTGHDIGSPDTSKGSPWITTIQTESWYDDNYMGYESYGGNLLSNIVGDISIDTSKPIDFTKYGITTGTPFSTATCNGDNYPCFVAFTIPNLQNSPLTIETFACGRPRYEGRDYVDFTTDVPIFIIGNSGDVYNPLPSLTFYVNPTNDGSSFAFYVTAEICGSGPELIGMTWTETTDISKWLAHWHHYAITIDSNNIYMFIDGELKGSASLNTQLSITYNYYDSGWKTGTYNKTLQEFINEMDMSTVTVRSTCNSDGYVFDARFAQFAVCQSCKWTSDFTVPTEAY
jgi:hypothetical protein